MDFTLIFCIFLTLILLSLTTLLFIFLFLKRDKFPYANISPLWTLTLLCCKMTTINSIRRIHPTNITNNHTDSLQDIRSDRHVILYQLDE